MSTSPSLSGSFNWKVAGVLVPSLLLLGALPASADKIQRHFKVDARPVVTIHNPNGTITVRAWTKSEVMVVATRASDQVVVDAEQIGNRVDILTRQVSESASPESTRADYEISVPEDAELQIHDDSGGVNVSNVLGDMNVETIAADVDMADVAGYLTVKTVGGAFQCQRCAGRLEVSSITGSFKLIDLRSMYVRAQTSEGNILFTGQFLPNSTYRLKNYNGVIEVRFSPEDSFDLSATSLKGKVHNEAKLVPPSHHRFIPRFGNGLFGSYNSGRAMVELSSFDGTINILKR